MTDTNRARPWLRRLFLLIVSVVLGLLVARLFDPRAGELAAEDNMEKLVRKEDRPEAPDLTGVTAWINVDKPLSMAALKGKVVLLDFWTFG